MAMDRENPFDNSFKGQPGHVLSKGRQWPAERTGLRMFEEEHRKDCVALLSTPSEPHVPIRVGKRIVSEPKALTDEEALKQSLDATFRGVPRLKHITPPKSKEWTLEDSIGGSRKRNETLAERRNGIPFKRLGDAQFSNIEYMPGYFAQGGLVPSLDWERSTRKKKTRISTLIVPAQPARTKETRTYSERRREEEEREIQREVEDLPDYLSDSDADEPAADK